ncbi:MAG: hypothetical protein LAO30_10280 [Acidobacteriia bacterium]|nr:hypothetical protein [Terriglobia bacterium]
MQEQALRIASHIPHPGITAALALILAAIVFALVFRARRPVVASILAAGLIVLGLTPLVTSNFLRSQGVYHVHVVLLRPDQSPVDIAQVKSSNGEELKMVEGGWGLDISPQTRPIDGKVTLFASVKDEFLKGSSTLVLAQDYYPTAAIQLVADTSAMLRGVVVDENLVAIPGAKVSIDGYPDVAVTDKLGNFVLPAHAGKGQAVEVRAQKGRLTGHLSAPAGKVIEVIIGRE